MKSEMFGAKEASEYLGIALSTMYDWVYKRKVRHYKMGGKLVFCKSDLDRILKEALRDEEL